jgi:hypothetical protein
MSDGWERGAVPRSVNSLAKPGWRTPACSLFIMPTGEKPMFEEAELTARNAKTVRLPEALG